MGVFPGSSVSACTLAAGTVGDGGRPLLGCSPGCTGGGEGMSGSSPAVSAAEEGMVWHLWHAEQPASGSACVAADAVAVDAVAAVSWLPGGS